jgi:predicted DNA-binding transcriptional regulator AlpA
MSKQQPNPNCASNFLAPEKGLPPTAQIIKWPKLHEMLGGRSSTSVWRDERAGKFPKRVRIGSQVGWFLHEVLEYLETLPRGCGDE